MSDKIYVYNHSTKTGGWFEMPFSVLNFQRCFGENYHEQQLEITDYDVSYRCFRTLTLDEIISYSHDFYDLSALEKKIVDSMVNEFGADFTEAIYDVATVRIYHCSSDEEFGKAYLMEESIKIPDEVAPYINYTEYVKDLKIVFSVLVLDEYYVILD